MLALLVLLSPAFATNVTVQYQPLVGRNAFVRFTDVVPGKQRTVEVPCGKVRACELSMTLTPVADKWRVEVRVDEIRRPFLGPKSNTLVAQPTFEVEAGQVASFFCGNLGRFSGTDPIVWWEQGVHVQAVVELATVAATE